MNDFLNISIFEINEHHFKVSNLAGFALLFLTLFILLFVIKRLVYHSSKFDISKKYAYYHLLKYVLVVFAFLIGIKVLGFNISILLAGSAALLVGLGLGLQGIFSDFISGIIILIDGTIKVNDIIEVNGIVCKVLEINFRTTMVLTRDDKYIILPNSDFTRNQIINWTHSEVTSRFEISVGVDYSSDIHLVMKVIEQVTSEHPLVLKKPAPLVRFNDYADSSLIFIVYFWAKEVFRVENIKSEIRVKLFDAFKENGIKIPFPQRVIHQGI